MAVAVKVELEISGDDLRLVADAEADLTDFHRKVNVLMLRNASQRLASQIKGDVRTGNLLRSLAIGGPENVNELGRNFGAIGSALDYAQKVNDGGRIEAASGKRLAVPVTEFLKRNPELWPSTVDPGRQLLQLIPREGKPPLLINPDNEDMVWVLLASVDWGEGYHYLEWKPEDLEEVEEIFYKHLGLER